jgi:hypothetical protein
LQSGLSGFGSCLVILAVLKRIVISVFIQFLWLSASADIQSPNQFRTGKDDSLYEDLFHGETVLSLNLYANFDSIIDDASVLRSVRRLARLQTFLPNDSSYIIPVQIETRGNFRMKPENCNFPPLKLSFFKQNESRTIFLKNNSAKLVSQCQIFQEDYKAYLLQEYLLYKIYAYLSNYSFKVRLLKISYINEGYLFDTLTRYCFALEPPKELARRYSAKRVNSNNVDMESIDQWQYKLVCFFEYMIMNNDWSIAICHNIELIQTGTDKQPVPVPFDFDWSGIIKVPYSVPSASGMKIIQPERSFKGEFRSRSQVKDMIRYFNLKRGKIYSMVSEFKELDGSYRLAFLQSLDDYYNILNAYFIFNKKIIHKQ